MFNQYKFIEETHRIALEAAIRNHGTLTAPLAVKLYQHALNQAAGKPGHENGFFYSHIETKAYVIGTCTCARTGLFIQLVSHPGNPHMWLTLGQKWAMENVDAVRGNINTIFW